MSENIISVEGLTAGYGESLVLDNVSFSLRKGRSMALLGRNGMGKSTLIESLMGTTNRSAGTISINSQRVEFLPTHLRASIGLGWVPQERRIFPSLTVERNLKVAAHPGHWTLNKVYKLFPRLFGRRQNRGNQLSGGEQQMLAIARALLINPSLLLLDEPLEGLSPGVVVELVEAIKNMQNAYDMSMIIVEQHAEIALKLTDDAVVLERGRVVHQATSSELLFDVGILERYIGIRRSVSSQ